MKNVILITALIFGIGIIYTEQAEAAPLCKKKSGNKITYYSTDHNIASDKIYRCVVKNGKAGREIVVGSMSAAKAKAKFCKGGQPFPAGTWPC